MPKSAVLIQRGGSLPKMQAISNALLERLSAQISDCLGLYFPKERWTDLVRGLNAALKELNLKDLHSCSEWLQSGLEKQDLETLASFLTVGETCFMREKTNCRVFSEHILPEISKNKETSERRIKVWSAGCCSGEEPYSFAILLREGLPEFNRWNLSILATDINPVVLNQARIGSYGEWSFRNCPKHFREKYFSEGPNEGRSQIHPEIKKMVEFSYLNLAEDIYPALISNTTAVNVIVCSNVLMYFKQDLVQQIIMRFYNALVPGGWLLLSPAETFPSQLKQFEASSIFGTTVYRKPQSQSSTQAAVSRDWDTPATHRAEGEPARQSRVDPASSAIQAELQPIQESQSLARLARTRANEGNLADARKLCLEAVASDRLNPGNHFLMAMIHQECGNREEAIASLHRSLYLDPKLIVANFALATLKREQGSSAESRKFFKNTLQLLKQLPRNEIVPESDGLTVEHLIEIVERNIL